MQLATSGWRLADLLTLKNQLPYFLVDLSQIVSTIMQAASCKLPAAN